MAQCAFAGEENICSVNQSSRWPQRYPVLLEVRAGSMGSIATEKKAGGGQSAVLPEGTLDPASLHWDRKNLAEKSTMLFLWRDYWHL